MEQWRSYVPLALVFLSGLGFSIQSVIIKFLSNGGLPGVYLTIFCRGIIQTIVSASFVWTANSDTSLFGPTRYVSFLLALRSTFGYASTATGFLAIEKLPVGDATVLIMLNGILCGILGIFVLDEQWKLGQMIATFTSLIGATLVCRPSFLLTLLGPLSSDQRPADPIGVAEGVAAAVFSSVAYITIRILGTTAKMPWPNVCFSQGLGQILLSLPVIISSTDTIFPLLTVHHLALIFVAGFIGTWSQIAMTVGMQKEKSATATAMRMSDVVFGFLWQGLFTADSVNMLSVIGASLVMSSILMVIAYKSNEIKTESNSAVEMTTIPTSSANSLLSTASLPKVLNPGKFNLSRGYLFTGRHELTGDRSGDVDESRSFLEKD